MEDGHHPVTPHEVAGHPRHTGRFWFDFAAAAAAIFISVVSLAVAIGGERTQRELLAANSWPFLAADIDQSDREGDSIRIRDEGVGPARVFDFEVSFDGVPVRGPRDLLRRCCGLAAPRPGERPPPLPLGLGSIASNVIRPGGALTLIAIGRGGDSAALFDRFDAAVPRLGFSACYCSVLDRCWVSDLVDLRQRPVRRCPAGASSFSIRD